MFNGLMINIVQLFYGLIILLADTSLQSRSEMIFETDISNEVFSETIYDNGYPDFSIPSSPAESNLTTFLLSQSKNYFADKTTREGLDITSPEFFQSKTTAQLYTVFPGTIWCGVGNLAGNSQVLGFFATTDSCCRAHDKCRLTIPPGTYKFGLRNTGYFTRSHCMCDERFYYCLKRTNSIVANKVGFTYFNILKPQCFRKDFPIVACLRWYNSRCLTYVVDQSDGREWQWEEKRFQNLFLSSTLLPQRKNITALRLWTGTYKFGLRNTGYFTRSHCMCDERFYYCLKRTNSIVANKVGFTYFNILKPQCFRKDFPIVACLRWYNSRCLTYVVDQSDGREWQWFDNRDY